MVGRPVGVGLRIRGVSDVSLCFIGFPALIGYPVIGCLVSVGRPVPDELAYVLLRMQCIRGCPVQTGRPDRMSDTYAGRMLQRPFLALGYKYALSTT